jgi:hypothetical protein
MLKSHRNDRIHAEEFMLTSSSHQLSQNLVRSLRAKWFVLAGVITLAIAPVLGDQRTPARQARPSQRPGSEITRVDDQNQGRGPRSSTPRPAARACPDGAHGADHAAAGSTGAVEEHMVQFCGMLPRAEATHTATTSGPWSNPRTWNGRLPEADARVLIPRGVTVTVDRELSSPLFWIRVEGVLRFAEDANTAIIADTIKVEESGRLEVGTSARPIAPHVTAQIIVKARDGKPIDHGFDPIELSRGIIAHGLVEFHGAAKTPFVPLSEMPQVGRTDIVVDEVPSGWRPGDTVVLTATEYDQDETFKLVRLNGQTVTVDRPIRYSRTLPAFEDVAGWPRPRLHVGNFTRNIQVRTHAEYAGNPKLQGHVMLMHRGGQQISWAGFYDLGRTTIKPVTDPTVQNGQRISGVNPGAGLAEENPRGRYSLHFHGAGPLREISKVEGCAIEVRRAAGFKIGLTNHSSNVSVRGCVSHNLDGSHYFTEEGDEIGDFTANLAIHSVGSGFDRDEHPRDVVLKADPQLHQKRRLDAGHRGTGFWLNGGGVDVIDNVSAGQAHSGFHLWTRPLNFRITGTYAVRFPVANLRDGSWASSADSLTIELVPIRFIGNTAYVLGRTKNRGEGGFLFELHGIATRSRFPNAPYSQLHNLLSWNAGGIKTQYTGNLHLKNVRVIGNFLRADDVGARLGAQGGNSDLIENLRVEGFPRGVTLPARSTIKGGYFATGIGIPLGADRDVTLDLTDMKFGPAGPLASASGRSLPDRSVRGTPAVSSGMQYDLHVQPIFTGAESNAAAAFAPRYPTKVQGHPNHPKGAQLYSIEQMPDYVLPDFGIPGLLDGKTTTREAWEKYRLAPGGVMAPPGSAPLPGLRSNAVFGSPVEVDMPSSPRAARAAGLARAVNQDRGSVRERAGAAPEPQSTQRPSREELAALRDQRMAARAARRQGQDPAAPPAPAEPGAAGEPRPRDQAQAQPPRQPSDRPARDQARTDQYPRGNRAETPAGQPRVRPNAQNPAAGQSDSAGPMWELAPKAGGGMELVPTGRRTRPPGVSAGSDQTVALADGAVLQGVTGSGMSVRWSQAYGPGSVMFDDARSAQTRARFSGRGTYMLHLTVEDQAGQKNTASVMVIVS